MNDKQLRGFVRIVEAGSFTSAADDLYITQSALSQQMKLLEQDVGFQLFDHRTHKATLTVAGRAFLPRAQQLLALYGRAVDEGRFLQRTAQEQRHPLTIGCLEEQFLSIWFDLSKIMRGVRPECEPIAIRCDDRDKLIRALLSGECQISVQLESRDYDKAGLLFLPFTTVHEVALFLTREEGADASLCTVDELALRTVAFHNERGYCLYEDSLRHHLATAFPMTCVLDPSDFGGSNGDTTGALLMPSLQLPVRAAESAVPLEWGGGIRLGVVLPPSPTEAAQSYAEGICEHFESHPGLWK